MLLIAGSVLVVVSAFSLKSFSASIHSKDSIDAI